MKQVRQAVKAFTAVQSYSASRATVVQRLPTLLRKKSFSPVFSKKSICLQSVPTRKKKAAKRILLYFVPRTLERFISRCLLCERLPAGLPPSSQTVLENGKVDCSSYLACVRRLECCVKVHWVRKLLDCLLGLLHPWQ